MTTKNNLLKIKDSLKSKGVSMEVGDHPIHGDLLISVSVSDPSSSGVAYYTFMPSEKAEFESVGDSTYTEVIALFDKVSKSQAKAIYKQSKQ